jgi:type IV pilus assembly protein PilE
MKGLKNSGSHLALRRMAGVTLIELMVVMLVVVILGAIAVPSYQNYVMRSNRAAARACLSEVAQFMERYYTTNLTYVDADPSDMNCMSEGNLDRRYTFDVNPAATQSAYRVRAVPIDAQAERDSQCGTLTLNQAGQRTESGSGTVADCW